MLAAVALAGALLSACSAPTPGTACGPGFCEGCCQGDRCFPGAEAPACGLRGQACQDCAAQGLSCGLGACVPPSCHAEGQSCAPGTACCSGLSCLGGACAADPAFDGGQDAGGVPDAGPLDGGHDAGTPDGGPGCAPGFTLCGAACVDLQTDPAHCGTCVRACLATEWCVAGGCTPSSDCRTNGPCPSGSYCDTSNGQCLAGCDTASPCGGGNEICELSSHQCVCAAGFHRCGGACTSDSSTQACGAGCATCTAPVNATASCAAGACSFTCNAGLSLCGASCVDLQTNPSHCGGCGAACALPNATAACVATTCAVASCALGFSDADGLASNGCESSCAGLSLTTSGSLDYELRTISLSGVVTLDGAAAPTGTPRGTVSFLLAGTTKSVDVALPTTGAASYATRLFAGVYRVTYGKSSDCGAGKMPCGAQVLHTALSLNASGSLALNVVSPPAPPTPLTVSGTVTVNGATLAASPSGQSRGTVRFLPSAGGAAVAAALGISGTATYSVQLFPGTYDVVVDGTAPCSLSGPLPCEASTRRKALSLTTSGSLNLDLPVVTLSGAVRVNGAQLAPSAVAGRSRGTVFLADAEGHGPTLDLGSTGAATYSAFLYTGTRSLFVANTQGCDVGPLPCQRWEAASAVPVNTSGSLDLNLAVVTVSGQVKVNGAAMAASPRGASRGRLSFTRGASQASVDLLTSGAAVYQALLYAGAYDAAVDNTLDCPDGPLPCGAKVARSQVPLTANGNLDVDVAVATVSGVVTANGAALASSPSGSSRGTLSFTGPTTVATSLSASGAATYAVTVYPGTTEVAFTNQADCPAGPTPCQRWVVSAALAVAGASSHSVNLPVLQVSGTVTVNGAAVGASVSGGERGALTFDAPALGAVAVGLGVSGAATYAVRLYPGSYAVRFGNATDCPAAAEGRLPCQGGASVASGAPITTSGSLSFDLSVLALSGTVTVDGAAMPTGTGAARGRLRFGLQPAGVPLSLALSASGPATYQTHLLRGTYDVGFRNDADCPAGATPCQHKILAGCRVP